MDQLQFSRISGAASATAGTALPIASGYTFANTIQAIDLEVAHIGLTITSPNASRNTFVSPYFNCPTPIVATGGAAQRAALSRKLEQLVYEAKKAFEQYDAVDARNRLAASELERRWNGKLEEIEAVKQRLSSLETERYSLSPEEEIRIRSS